jgi:hypothetical protein
MRRRTIPLALGACLLAATAPPMVRAADPAAEAAPAIVAVRDATEAFRDQAAAIEAGYAILAGTPLEACIDEPDAGGMGFHLVSGELVGDAVLDAATPEALLYIPDAIGQPELVGVEYVVFAEAWDATSDEPPMLLGQELELVEAPNRYELPAFYALHAWVWRSNPAGIFTAFNPTVSCAVIEPPTLASTGTHTSH